MQTTPDSDRGWRSVLTLTPYESRWLAAVVFAGLALRVALLLFRTGDLRTDPDAYVAHAETLLQTGGYNVPGTDKPTAFRPPLYPMVLAAARWMGFKTLFSIGAINALATGMLITGTWWVARAVGLRGILPSIAAIAVALDPLQLRYTGLPMTEALTAGLLTLAVLDVLKSQLCQWTPDCDSTDRRRSFKAAVTAGVYFGLAGLCRPVTLVTCAVLTTASVVQLLMREIKTRRDASRSPQLPHISVAQAMTVAVLPGVVAGLVLLPWVIRNAVQFHEFIPATTHGGYTLLLGNNEVFYREVVLAEEPTVWSGPSLDRWQQELRAEMLQEGVDPLDETAMDEWAYARAFEVIRSQPGTFVQACLLRWQRFWSVAPTKPAEGTAARWASGLVAVWYSVLWIGVAGSVLPRSRAFREYWSMVFDPSVAPAAGGPALLSGTSPSTASPQSSAPADATQLVAAEGVSAGPAAKSRLLPSSGIHVLWLSVLSFLLLHSFYWTNARMRAPLMGILCVLAVTGWQSWAELIQRRRS